MWVSIRFDADFAEGLLHLGFGQAQRIVGAFCSTCAAIVGDVAARISRLPAWGAGPLGRCDQRGREAVDLVPVVRLK